jgi:predicted O-methyltransferase YrrM
MRARILQSKALPLLVFPYRCRLIVRHLARNFKESIPWLFRSKEFANFTYDLTAANKEYLAWFVADICGVPASEIRDYFNELENDSQLDAYIKTGLANHRRGNEIDRQAFFGRRLGWYAIVRATKPLVVVETGTEKGLGSLVLAEALLKNGSGRLITIDMEPSSGLLIGAEYGGVIERVISDSLLAISKIDQIDLFIHDSDHSAEHEAQEFEILRSHLTADAIVLSDNSHATTELANWSLRNNRRFMYFAEEPLNHWYPGAGIGVSMRGL